MKHGPVPNWLFLLRPTVFCSNHRGAPCCGTTFCSQHSSNGFHIIIHKILKEARVGESFTSLGSVCVASGSAEEACGFCGVRCPFKLGGIMYLSSSSIAEGVFCLFIMLLHHLVTVLPSILLLWLAVMDLASRHD